MLYCDYDTYTAQGGTLTAEQFAVWGRRASSLIDYYTMGRAKRWASDSEVGTQLADACAQIVDVMQAAGTARTRAAAGLASAATNDGYSESYLDAQQLNDQVRTQGYSILREALGSDPKNLLYAGVCGCFTVTIL